MRKNIESKNKAKLIVAIILMIVVLGTISYGAFFTFRKQTDDNVILSSCFSTTLTNESASINLTKAVPLGDEEGISTTPYTFTINNTCNLNADYYVIISSTISTACGGETCYGHALSETSRWYKDYLLEVANDRPWFDRGTGQEQVTGDTGGIFGISGYYGIPYYNNGVRSVLI